MKKDWFEIFTDTLVILVIVLTVLTPMVLIYGVLTGKLNIDDTENIWFWLFLLK